MVPKVMGHKIELIIIQPFYYLESKYSQDKKGSWIRDEHGKRVKDDYQTFVKENRLRVICDIADIKLHGEYANKDGKVLKTRSQVFNVASGDYYKVAHSIDEINQALKPKKPIGYI